MHKFQLVIAAIVAISTSAAYAENEFLCEALCTYKKNGAVNRTTILSRDANIDRAWQRLEQTCIEIQSLAAKKNLTKLTDPLLASRTVEQGNNKEYELTPATADKQCSSIQVGDQKWISKCAK